MKKILFILVILFSFFWVPADISAQSGPADPEKIPTIKVKVIIYDPILNNIAGTPRLHEWFQQLHPSWNSVEPVQASRDLVNDLNTKSHGKVQYQIVQTTLRDEFPEHVDNFIFDDESYVAAYEAEDWDNIADGDFVEIANDNGIVSQINSGAVDEVWLWGAPGFAWPETVMAGPGAFELNNEVPKTGINTNRAFVFMPMSYERAMGEAIHNFGHRAESTIRRNYDGWHTTIEHDWDLFTALDKQTSGRGGMGNIHYPYNLLSSDPEYTYDSTNSATTSANDWTYFPYMRGTTSSGTCSQWGCDQYGYIKWWFDHIPYVAGIHYGYANNWWRYLIDVNQYKYESYIGQSTAGTDYAENNAASWACTTVDNTCSLSNESSNKKYGSYSTKLTTSGTDDVSIKYPSAGNANWDLRLSSSITFWAYATNTNQYGFQDNTMVEIKDSSGNGYRYVFNDTFNPAIDGWKRYEIPISGNSLWTRTTLGTPNLANVDYIQIFTDTWGGGFTLTVDGVGFITDYTSNISPLDWGCNDDGSFPGCSNTASTTKVKEGTHSIKHTVANDATWTYMAYPASGNLSMNATGKNLVFWMYVDSGTFDGATPRIMIDSNFPNGGTYEYTTTVNLGNGAKGRWQRIEIPVEGNSFWTRTTYGTVVLTDIDRVVVAFDNLSAGSYVFYVDGLRFEGRDTTNPTISITSPVDEANVPWSYTITASSADNTALKRVDFFQDGQYIGTDAIAPYTFFVDHQPWGSHTLTTKAYDMYDNVTTSTAVDVFQADKSAGEPFFSDDFELGFPVDGWASETDTENDLSVSSWANLHGQYGLKSVIDNTTTMYLTDSTPNNESRMRSRFYVDPNNLAMAAGDEFTVMSGRVSSGSSYTVQLGWNTGAGYQVRPVIYNDAAVATYGTWVKVTNASHALEIDWKAATSAGANNGYITFWVDGAEQYTIGSIDNDTKRIDDIRFGVVDSIDSTTTGTMYMDDYVTNQTTYIGPMEVATDITFSDGFETGDTSGWNWEEDAENDISVTTAAALNGTYGLSTLVDNTTEMYLKSFVSPDQNQYRARFHLDPNSITMASADTFNIFSGRTSAGTSFSVQLNYSSSSGYRIRTQIYDDAAVALNGNWVNITDASHSIEIDWKASSSAGANNGYVSLWIDGTSQGSQSGVDNDTKRVNEARFGAVANIDSGTSGTIYLDKFQSNKTQYIGP